MRISKSTNIEASTTDVLEPTVDNVLDLIENKKIVFKNDVAYWSRGKRVLPKEYRDCIEQTQYAHWVNEWSCEQAEKFGDRAYYDYDGDTEVKASNMRISKSNKTSVKASAAPNTPDANKEKLVRQIIKQAEEIRDYFQSHNNNLNRKQEQYLEDLSDGIDNESVAAIRDAIENMKYNSKNLRSEQYNLIIDLYDEFNFAGGKFEGMGRPGSDDIGACGDVKASTVNTDAIKYIKAAIDVLGKSGNKDSVTKDSIANLATVMFDLKSSDKGDK